MGRGGVWHDRWLGIPTVQVTGSKGVRVRDLLKLIYGNLCQPKLEITNTIPGGLGIGTIQAPWTAFCRIK
jgi:hypothetical protein